MKGEYLVDDIDRYLGPDSPFLLEVALDEINPIVRDLFEHDDDTPAEAVARCLNLLAAPRALSAFERKLGRSPIGNVDFIEYMLGFTISPTLLPLAHIALRYGSYVARRVASDLDDARVRAFIMPRIDLTETLLRADPSGRLLMEEYARSAREEVLSTGNIYYAVGVEACRRLFGAYLDIIEPLLAVTAINGEPSLPDPAIPNLRVMHNNTVHVPNDPYNVLPSAPDQSARQRRIARQRRRLERFQRAVSHPTTMSLLALMARDPLVTLRSLRSSIRLARAARGDPELWTQVYSQLAGVIPTLMNLHDGNEETTSHDLIWRLAPASYALDEYVPEDSVDTSSFLARLAKIRRVGMEASDVASMSELAGHWEALSTIAGLTRYSALWTAIQLACGIVQERLAACHNINDMMGSDEAIRRAWLAYLAPLRKSSIWRADLGTRHACMMRLSDLYCRQGLRLGLSPAGLARAIYDVSLDLLRANERLYQREVYWGAKVRLQAHNEQAAGRAAEACVFLGEQAMPDASVWRRRAFMVVDSAKSRMIREEMALADLIPPTALPGDLAEVEAAALIRLRQIYADLNTRVLEGIPSSAAEIDQFAEERRSLRLDLEMHWARMEGCGEEAHAYVAMRRDEALSWAGLDWDRYKRAAACLGSHAALIAFTRLPGKILVGVFTAEMDSPELRVIDLSDETLAKYLNSFRSEVLHWRPYAYHFGEWQKLGDVLLGPVESLLHADDRLYFLPSGVFHSLPLHALTLRGKPIIAHWPVAYAPALSVFESIRRRPRRRDAALVMGFDHLVGEGTAGNTGLQGKSEMLIEAAEVAEHFGVALVSSEESTRASLLEKGTNAQLIHIACHGIFDSSDPLMSGIELRDGRFTARQWFASNLSADIVTLASCQAGVTDVRPGDDLYGFMRAILFAGSSSVLLPLWSVNSAATHKWMRAFYREGWYPGGKPRCAPILAHQRATEEIRSQREDPYFWAPFILVGGVPENDETLEEPDLGDCRADEKKLSHGQQEETNGRSLVG